MDLVAWPDLSNGCIVVGCALVDPAVGAVLVVVVDVLDEQCSELFLVPDDFAVEQFVSKCADPSFGVRARLCGAWRDPESGDPAAGEDIIE